MTTNAPPMPTQPPTVGLPGDTRVQDQAGLTTSAARTLGPETDWTPTAVVMVNERSDAATGDDSGAVWQVLQPWRNGLAVAVALTPVDGLSLAARAANLIAQHGVINTMASTSGGILCPIGAVCLGRLAPGPLGSICAAAWALASKCGRALWRFARSGHGWILTRPLIWAVVLGGITGSWHVIVRTLTGA